MKKNLPDVITAHDLLKVFAVITMVIDHVGYYFFPEQEWWRVAGRMSGPVWFFLAGYARSRDISRPLMTWAAALTAASLVLEGYIFPLNALVTIMLIRLGLDNLMRFFTRNTEQGLVTLVLLFALTLPSFMVFEYGTLAVFMAMLGYMARRTEMDIMPDPAGRRRALAFMVFAAFTYIFYQQINFSFAPAAFAGMAVGVSALLLMLSEFRARTYPSLTARLPRAVTVAISFTGHKTMEIYVLHLILFKVMAELF